MAAAPLPPNELQRLAALDAASILDTPADDVFDSFVRVASGLFDTPIAAVSFVAQDRQWFKAATGLGGVQETPRDQSFCAHAILDPSGTFAVPDATLDERFRDNPLVTGDPGIRFYAGASVVDALGVPLGALCVIDRVPRIATPAQMAQLRDLATGVSAALQLHGTLHQLHDQATRDHLTGLNNRGAFDRCIAAPVPPGSALLMVDLDGFKQINDTFGHPAGDAALQEAARRLCVVVRKADMLFRLGGDEFAVLLRGPLAQDDLRFITDRIHEVLADPFPIDGQAVSLRASIGAAVLHAGADAAASLLSVADTALYQAKRTGQGLTRIANLPDNQPSPTGTAGNGHSLTSRLKRALVPPGLEPFNLVFQPIVDLTDNQVRSLEALVRWSPEPGDIVPPSEFVPLAERNGLAASLDRWVLRTACRAAASWSRPWGVSVNISAATLGSADVPGLVRRALADTGLQASRLTIELTETALISDPVRAGRQVKALRGLGVGIALDDFGAGHASLVNLRAYDFTKLKIDRAIVSGVDGDTIQRHCVEFIAELGDMLGLAVVAEGVERQEELNVVRACGVAECQGYLLARPAIAADLDRTVAGAIEAASANPVRYAPVAAE